MTQAKILIVDDEPGIRKLLTSYLEAEGYQVFSAADGPSGYKSALAFQPDLIILDINLPGMDGIELLAQLRRQSDVYIIMLTAKAEETDKIVGLSVGADDYLTKPFSPRELVARVKAALRRIHHSATTGAAVLAFQHLRIDTGSRQVWVNDRPVELTTTEFDLLQALAEQSGMVFSRERLLEKVWGQDYFGEIRVVDVHVGHIRQKIGEELIATVRGVGYRLTDQRIA